MSTTPDVFSLMHTAIEAAYAGGRRAMAHYNNRVEVEIKSDGSPVTLADKQSEEMILKIIRDRYPQSDILSEESGQSGPKGAGLRWIIDPLDGTKTFITGAPLWGVMIGAELNGKAVAGAVYFPALDDMISAGTGLGCHWNGRRTKVSTVSDISQAVILTTDWPRAQRRSTAFETIAKQSKLTRTWGDCFGHCLVATGRADAMLDPILNPWDCAPLLPILQEAGGHFVTWKGEPTIWGPDGISVNAGLKDPLLKAIREIET